MNIQIETEIEPNYSPKLRLLTKDIFDVRIVDKENQSNLMMKDKDAILFDAALKYIKYRDIRQADFSNMNLLDNHLYQIAVYLNEIPNLRSINLDSNKLITDDGLGRIADALEKNNKLAHISFKDCPMITNDGMKRLNDIISKQNTVVFSVEFNEKSFDPEISKSIKYEAQLNRAI